MLGSFDGKLVDLVGSRRLVDLYLVFCDKLPLYVLLLVYDWEYSLAQKCLIEVAEQWQHGKKVEVLQSVQKSVLEVQKKR